MSNRVHLDFNKALAVAVKAPMVKIDRAEFLKNNFSREVEPKMVDKIVQTSPIKAGVSEHILEKIARECIKYETYNVSALSLGTGFGGVFGITADFAQYLVHVLRISQKLAYIYGYPSIISIDGGMDDATKNIILLFIGMMYGVKGTEKVIAKLSITLAEQIAKNISREALTKTAWYPLLKEICKQVGIKVTKDTLGKAVTKVVPGIGGVVSAGFSYYCFGKGAERLHETLRKKSRKITRVKNCEVISYARQQNFNHDWWYGLLAPCGTFSRISRDRTDCCWLYNLFRNQEF